MESCSQILIFAKPGHFRDSLVAVLRTLPRVELFLVDLPLRSDIELPPKTSPTLLLADLEGIGMSKAAILGSLKKNYPDAGYVLLANEYQRVSAIREFGADIILPRDASTGELLSTVQRLNGGHTGSTRYFQPYPVPLIS
jgi:DNA-binding NarL/FixJ family response regulator